MALRTRLCLALLILLALSGCAMTQERLVQNVARETAELKSYYAEAEAVVFSPGGEQRYVVRQWVQAPALWRVEVNSEGQQQVFLSDGEQIIVYQPGVAEYLRLDARLSGEVPPPFLLLGYLETLLKARSLKLEGIHEETGQKSYVVSFESIRQDEMVRVHLDTRHFFPLVVEIYQSGQILSHLTRKQFQLDPSLDAGLFNFTPSAGGEVVASCCPSLPISLDEARNNWVLPLYIPRHLPEGARLFSVTLAEEEGRPNLIQIYDGENGFTLVQREKGKRPVEIAGLAEVTVGNHRGLFRQNMSGGLKTLCWSNETSDFLLIGFAPWPEMFKVAESLSAD